MMSTLPCVQLPVAICWCWLLRLAPNLMPLQQRNSNNLVYRLRLPPFQDLSGQ